MTAAETNMAEGAALPQRPRYTVGIDLGTTNSALAYVDTTRSPVDVVTFPIPQLVAAGTAEALEVLPSFHYEPATGEFAAGQLRLPGRAGDEAVLVGRFARDHGTQVPARLVASALVIMNGSSNTSILGKRPAE